MPKWEAQFRPDAGGRRGAMTWDRNVGDCGHRGSSRGGAAEQAVRAPDQDDDHDGVDDEVALFGT